MLDAVGLIHMNGRVYDPTLGRFLSADPTMQFPKNMQNYNRYSYVLNNPLSYTDPSGFFLSGLFKAIGSVVKSVGRSVGSALKSPYVQLALGIVVGFYTGFATYGALINSGAAIGVTTAKVIAGAAGGFAGGFVGSGGDFKAAVIGGLTGAAAGYIGSADFFQDGFSLPGGATSRQVIAHGVVGGAAAESQGGKFGQGFVSSAFTKSGFKANIRINE